MPRRKKYQRRIAAHIAPPEVQAPELIEEVPLFMRLERQTEDESGEQMRERLLEKIREEDSAMSVRAPFCEKCQSHRPMKSRGRKETSFITRFGKISMRVQT